MSDKNFWEYFDNIPTLDNTTSDDDQNDIDTSQKISTFKNVNISTQSADVARRHAEKAAETFAKSDKYIRKTLEDSSKMKSVKLNAFKDGAKVKDPFTGKELLLTVKEAKMKYGEKWADHLAETDHTVPLKQIYEKHRKNPFLKNDDIKAAANSDSNLQNISRSVNNPKRANSNTDFVNNDALLKKKNIKLTKKGKQNAIEAQNKAEKEINKQLVKSGAKNLAKTANKAGVEAGAIAAVISAVFSVSENVVALVKGEKEVSDAVIDITSDTAQAALLGYSTAAAGTVVKHAFEQSSNQLLKSLSATNLPVTIVYGAIETTKTVSKYLNGEIDGKECAIELGEKTVGFFGSEVGFAVGQSLIPIPIIGGLIGSMIGYALSTAIYDGLVLTIQNKNLIRKERKRIEAESKRIIKAIRQYRREIEQTAEQYFAEYTAVFETALDTIGQALQSGNVNGVIAGSNMITDKLGGVVQYNNMVEFDNFMNNEDLDFIL